MSYSRRNGQWQYNNAFTAQQRRAGMPQYIASRLVQPRMARNRMAALSLNRRYAGTPHLRDLVMSFLRNDMRTRQPARIGETPSWERRTNQSNAAYRMTNAFGFRQPERRITGNGAGVRVTGATRTLPRTVMALARRHQNAELSARAAADVERAAAQEQTDDNVPGPAQEMPEPDTAAEYDAADENEGTRQEQEDYMRRMHTFERAFTHARTMNNLTAFARTQSAVNREPEPALRRVDIDPSSGSS